MRNLYKSFLKQGILPSEVDKQDLDVLLWVCLSDSIEKEKEETVSTDRAINGLF